MTTSFPMGADLDQELDWAQKKLKPWMMNKQISYWAENSRHWEIAQGTMDWLVKSVREQRKLNGYNK